ncbi:MAG: cytochrome-c peroxidase [Proteobacteria bacterium]|nr:cytochrome-c peroxidase [Pseudomonadota bacterium]
MLNLLLDLGCRKPPPPEPAAPSTAAAASSTPTAATPASAEVDTSMLQAFAALPAAIESPKNPLSEPKIALGRMLYFDKRLSKNHDVACNDCHLVDRYGVDSRPVSNGHRQQKGTRNAPTVYNAAGHVAQFWDGRAADVEEQAKGPLLNPVEQALASAEAVVRLLKSMPGYVTAFRAAFPQDKDPLTFDNVALAIGAFERKLVTPSRWDKFLQGDRTALTDEEKRGFNTFVATGCPTCHMGAYVGGQMFQKLGLIKPWPNTKDQGRFEVTKQETDRMFFKAAALRNVTQTAPFFHDGSEPSLEQAVRRMAEFQLGRDLSSADAKAIVVWLGALAGELPTAYIAVPELPPSTKKTPKPDPS